jgi:hypothetical protein
MNKRNLSLLILMALLTHACIPVPPSSPTPTSIIQETLTPGENLTPTSTPSAIFTETATPTDTETSTPTSTSVPTSSPSPLSIPALNDWDAGSLAFSHGAQGEWDHILWGGFANSLIKKGDIYYLYYQGSLFYDDTDCESVAHRSIGVATSTDGIHWTKSSRNPVITWTSQGSIEEGAVSSAAWLGPDGRIYIYYGANTGSGCLINASARLAMSDDGESFLDLGVVLSGSDPNVWGSGDEIFPIGISSHENQWHLYYTPNGVLQSRKLGVAIGSSPNIFTQSFGINDGAIPAWGPVSIIIGSPDSVLITNPNDGSAPINIYKFDAQNPSLVQLHDSYELPNCTQASVIYESVTRHWMLSCRDQNADNYYIRNAFTP